MAYRPLRPGGFRWRSQHHGGFWPSRRYLWWQYNRKPRATYGLILSAARRIDITDDRAFAGVANDHFLPCGALGGAYWCAGWRHTGKAPGVTKPLCTRRGWPDSASAGGAGGKSWAPILVAGQVIWNNPSILARKWRDAKTSYHTRRPLQPPLLVR